MQNLHHVIYQYHERWPCLATNTMLMEVNDCNNPSDASAPANAPLQIVHISLADVLTRPQRKDSVGDPTQYDLP